MTKQGIMIQVDSEFADALDSAARTAGQIRSVFIRSALASYIGYDKPVNIRNERRRKYATAAERAAAAALRAQKKNAAERDAFAALKAGNTVEAQRIMQEYEQWKADN